MTIASKTKVVSKLRRDQTILKGLLQYSPLFDRGGVFKVIKSGAIARQHAFRVRHNTFAFALLCLCAPPLLQPQLRVERG